jgi:renal tumor antigen
MTDGYYNEKMDVWGFGCVMFELITKYPLFPGKDELDQVNRIHHVLGTPSEEVLGRFRAKSSHMEINFASKKGSGLDRLLPNIPPEAKDLIKRLLEYDPIQRISA